MAEAVEITDSFVSPGSRGVVHDEGAALKWDGPKGLEMGHGGGKVACWSPAPIGTFSSAAHLEARLSYSHGTLESDSVVMSSCHSLAIDL